MSNPTFSKLDIEVTQHLEDCNNAIDSFIRYIESHPSVMKTAVKFSSSTNMDLEYTRNLVDLCWSYVDVMLYDLMTKGYEFKDVNQVDRANDVKNSIDCYSKMLEQTTMLDLYENLGVAIYAIHICSKTDQDLLDWLACEDFTPEKMLALTRVSNNFALSIKESRSKKAA